MTSLQRILTAAAIATGLSGPALAADSFEIDPTHTNVVFLIDHLGYSKMIGDFNEISGSFVFDQENVANSKVELVIQAASIDTDHEARDEHLRSPDFLNVEEFPEITFVSTSVEQTGDNTGKVTGDLTLLGATLPVTLDVTFNSMAPHPIPAYNGVMVAGFSARAQVNRIDHGMTYAQGGIGDVLDLIIEVEGFQK